MMIGNNTPLCIENAHGVNEKRCKTRKLQVLRKYSSPERVLALTRKYVRKYPIKEHIDKDEDKSKNNYIFPPNNLLGIVSPHVALYMSSRKNKKYMLWIRFNDTTRTVHFGQIPYEDYTHHHNRSRRKNYLQRATNIKGAWKTDPYSPNNLAIHLLW
jgi:hypothetical protein